MKTKKHPHQLSIFGLLLITSSVTTNVYAEANNVSNMMQGMQQMMQLFNRLNQMPNTRPETMLEDESEDVSDAAALQGLWQGADGNLMVIQEQKFQIYAQGGRYVAGIFMVYKDRMIIYNPQTDRTFRYIFAVSGNKLMLRDREGGIMLYQQRSQQIPVRP